MAGFSTPNPIQLFWGVTQTVTFKFGADSYIQASVQKVLGFTFFFFKLDRLLSPFKTNEKMSSKAFFSIETQKALLVTVKDIVHKQVERYCGRVSGGIKVDASGRSGNLSIY
jgi:hypothetical protein